MKIALLSYEYPPDTAFGGIATYTQQVARIMQQRGHTVEVFAGSAERQRMTVEDGLRVHRVQVACRTIFGEAIAPLFAQRHNTMGFDVLESPEIGPESQEISRLVPRIPLVIKAHTPTYLLHQMNQTKPTLQHQARWILGALCRGKLPSLYPTWTYDPQADAERQQTLHADLITTPSKSLGEELIATWHLDPQRVIHLPNPYIPSPALLNIPLETNTHTITFIGRLEVRKGILDLAEAIPIILRRFPQVRFRIVGASWPSPKAGLNMQQYLQHKLRPHQAALEFHQQVPLSDIPHVLAQTDICVFPSRWENFPNVCLEAMAAGRGVIGSTAGGMADMLEQGHCGYLVEPRRPDQIAEAAIALLSNPSLRMELGRAARQRVLAHYNLEVIGQAQEAVYERAIGMKTNAIANLLNPQ